MPKATRNRALVVVREKLAAHRADRDRIDAAIGVLVSTEAALVDAYTRKPTRSKDTARTKVKKVVYDPNNTAPTLADIVRTDNA